MAPTLISPGNSIPQVPAYTQKANRPGYQPNVPGSAVALNALFAFGGGNPFLAVGSSATKPPSASSKATSGTNRERLAGTRPQVARTRLRLTSPGLPFL